MGGPRFIELPIVASVYTDLDKEPRKLSVNVHDVISVEALPLLPDVHAGYCKVTIRQWVEPVVVRMLYRDLMNYLQQFVQYE